MPSIRSCISVAALVLVACGSEPRSPKLPEVGNVFPSLPLPPQPEFIARSGSADALQITFFSPTETPKVIDYYRKTLSGGGWRLISDVKNPDGAVVLYAEQKGMPMWVRIWSTSDKAGTMVELSGAVVARDSMAIREGAESRPKERSSRPTS
jgi:hypothetical protein